MSSNKLRVKQPYKLLSDIWGVITSWDFIQELNNYSDNNLKDYLIENWSQNKLKDFVQRLRERCLEENKSHKDLPLIDSGSDPQIVIQSVLDNIKWRKTNGLKTFDKDINQLYESLWRNGYESHKLKTHAFDDVLPCFEEWTAKDPSIKIYTFASGSPQKQKLFLNSSIYEELGKYVICGIDSFHKYKDNPDKFKLIPSALLEDKPQNILYLTDSPNKAIAAKRAGMEAIVVLRPGNKIYSKEKLSDLQTITSLKDLDFFLDISS